MEIINLMIICIFSSFNDNILFIPTAIFFWFQGFRDTSTEVQVMSFSAWNILIDNFALSPGNVSLYIIVLNLFAEI